jgi:hypothetical protein
MLDYYIPPTKHKALEILRVHYPEDKSLRGMGLSQLQAICHSVRRRMEIRIFNNKLKLRRG